MDMKLTNKETKSILAKLLASENLTIEHGNFSTASFDVKNRVLRLPVWKEMSGNLYDLLVLHEVGHALFTPVEGHHDAKGHGKGFKSFLNVVEDARIERKIKVKFPGGRRGFVEGYKDLMERDFFGIKSHDPNELGLIDRINLHYKVGSHVDINFSNEESVFVDRIDKAETWKTVVKICEDLYDYAKENESETDMSDHDFGDMEFEESEDGEISFGDFDDSERSENEESDEEESNSKLPSEDSDEEENSEEDCESGDAGGDETGEDSDGKNTSTSDEGDENGEEESKDESGGAGSEGGYSGQFDPDDEGPKSLTDENFRNSEGELVDPESKPYRYLDMPDIPLDKVVVNYKEILSIFKTHYEERGDDGKEELTQMDEWFKSFRNKNKKVVEYLAKEFEMKKAAKDHARAATANSGILNSEKLYTYKYNEHLFKKLTVIPDGKNHGLVMFVDWSGSMSRNMKGTIEQMMTLVMFCKRVNIPFDVYAFSDSYYRRSGRNEDGRNWNGYLLPKDGIPKINTLAIQGFSLLNFFSSRMNAVDLKAAYTNMMGMAESYKSRYAYGYYRGVSFPSVFSLGGTPLDPTLIMAFPVMRDFLKRNRVDVINSIFLTDGDSSGSGSSYWKPCEEKTEKEWDAESGEYVDKTYNGCNGLEIEHFNVGKENVIVRDSVSKKSMSLSGYRNRGFLTKNLVGFIRDTFNINIVNFFILDKMKRWDMHKWLDEIEQANRKKGETAKSLEWDATENAMKDWRKNKYMIAPGVMGFNDLYLVLGGKQLEVEDEALEISNDASKAQMTTAFKKFSKGKLENRRLLSRFVSMVAA